MFLKSFKMFNSNFIYQFLATFLMQLLCVSHGIALGWLAPTLHTLMKPSEEGPFMVTIEQASWIGSLYGLVSLLGNIVFGVLLNRLGRKLCLYLLAGPHAISWILIFFSKSYVYLYVSRLLAGLTAGGIFVTIPLFISEISDPSKRGMLSSMPSLFICVGIFFGFILSSYMEYYLIPCAVIALPIIYAICMAAFPETPQHLLRKQKIEEARKSYDYYNRNTSTVQHGLKNNDAEFEAIKNAVLNNTNGNNVTLKDFVDIDFLKPFSLALLLIFANQFSGYFSFFNYMTTIFAESGTAIEPNICTIIMGVGQVSGTLCTLIIVDRYGRKIIMLVSCSGMGLGLIVFGLYIKYTTAATKLQFSWVPVVLMIFIVFIGSIGLLGCVFIIIVEILPMKMRAIGTSICMEVLSCSIFVALKIFPLILHHYGLHVLLFCCGTVCIVSWFCILIFQKETKGLNINK